MLNYENNRDNVKWVHIIQKFTTYVVNFELREQQLILTSLFIKKICLSANYNATLTNKHHNIVDFQSEQE